MKHYFQYLILCLLNTILFSSCVFYNRKVYNEQREKLYHDYYGLPKQIGRINDFEGVFSKNEIQSLDSIILNSSTENSNDIVIITIDTLLEVDDLEEFTNRIDNYWEVGGKKENGLIFTISRTQRKIRIRTDIETSKHLSDQYLKEIIDKYMIPEFKDEKYYQGLKTGLILAIEKLR